MDYNPMDPGVGGLGMFGGLAILIGIATTLFWMYLAWRAMLAHEEIGRSLARLAAKE
jgi:TRAP-type uncharacterized transport system fused permease subunit